MCHMLNDRIERIRVIDSDKNYSIGTVVIGKICKLLPSSNACFVNIGNGEDFFLTLPNDLSRVLFTDGKKHDKIKCEDEIVVQIKTEAIKLKQPSLTCDISITGRFSVISLGHGLSISKKISESDRKSLVLPENINELSSKYHITIRTEAGVTSAEYIEEDIITNIELIEKIVSSYKTAKTYSILYKPPGLIEQLTKEWLKFSPTEFLTDEEHLLDQIKEYTRNENITVKLYEDDDYPLYKLYKLESLIDELLNKKVYLSSGAFLIVEQCETLTAIDVNSGHMLKGNKEEASLKINLEAIDEIVHVLRSRNISGMILIDFINQTQNSNVKLIVDKIREVIKSEDVRTTYIDMTGLGLMELTRQRKYSSFKEQWKGK